MRQISLTWSWVSIKYSNVGLTGHVRPLRFIYDCTLFLLFDSIKVSKDAKIRNRYNQVPHQTQYNQWESDKLTVRHHKRGPVSKHEL